MQLLYVSEGGNTLALMDEAEKEVRTDLALPEGDLGERILKTQREGERDEEREVIVSVL